MSTKDSVIRGPKSYSVKTRKATVATLTATQVATLPKGARISYFLLRGIASNAVTTATLSIGTTSANSNELVNGADVKTAAAGVGPTLLPSVSGSLGAVLTADTPIFFKYADTGGAGTVGAWFIDIVYTTGNLINDTTV